MVARLLRQWLLRPSIDRAEIESRRDGVADLHGQVITRTELGQELQPVLDIERLLAKITLGSATARDIVGLGGSLACLPAVRRRIAKCESARMRRTHEQMDELPDIRERIETIAERYEKPEEVINAYYGDERLLQSVEQTTLTEQVVDHVAGLAAIETVQSTFQDVMSGNPGSTSDAAGKED
jgi:DNA mismatch repair ATPase MutS